MQLQGGGVLWNVAALKKVRDASSAGDPNAQYLIGLAATLDSTLQIPQPKAHELLLSAAQGGEPHAQYWVGRQLAAMGDCVPKTKILIWLRHAAGSGEASAQVALAAELLKETPSADQIGQAKTLLEQAASSDSFYVKKHVAALLAASPIESVRNPMTALAVARRLAKDEIQSDPQMFEVIAAANAANADFRAAASHEETAISRASALAWNTSRMAERLQAYQKSQPWYGDVFDLPPVTDELSSHPTAQKVCESDSAKCAKQQSGRYAPDSPQTPLGSHIPQ